MTAPNAWSRRGFLAAGAAAALAACTGHSSDQPSGSSPSTGGSSGPPTRTPWGALDASTSGHLVLPDAKTYDSLRQTPNPRYDSARPLALLLASSAKDVAAGLKFAADHDLPLALRSGGHSYPGWSAGGSPRALVIDCRKIDAIAWDGTDVTMGPGRLLADVYSGVAARGRAIPGGSCPTVGLGGLTLGGGVGVLTRSLGLTCDSLTAAQVVLADGRIVTASPTSHPDLFWALRGGGGGHIGVTTSMTFSTSAAPTISSTYLTWPATAAAELVPMWFDWIDGADPALWSTLKLLGGSAHSGGLALGATVTWTGPSAAFEQALGPILATRPTGRYDDRRSYLATMQKYAGSGAREAFAATSHIAYDPLDSAAARTLADHVSATAVHLHEGGASIDALGGRVANLAPTDTAFVHRKARATVQYTATYDTGSAKPAQEFVEGLRATMTPTLGNHAYVNYADPTLDDPGQAYFGTNWSRLQHVRATYDPGGLFTQPQ